MVCKEEAIALAMQMPVLYQISMTADVVQMQRHLHEGMGNCIPTPSGQRHIISGHTNHSEQSLVDMQGAQGSVQGLDRRALGRPAPLDGVPTGQPLGR